MLNILYLSETPSADDELRRGLSLKTDDWETSYARSQYEALTLLANRAFDVVVTDFRSASFHIPEFLRDVSRRFPQMIRIMLSEKASDLTFDTILASHRYLLKPCNVDDLSQEIDRANRLRWLLSSDKLLKRIARSGPLPTLPAAYSELSQLLQNDNTGVWKVTQIISKHPTVAAKVLQVANSAFFAARRQVVDITQAVNIIGFEFLKLLVLSTELFSVFSNKVMREFKLKERWEHAWSVANYAAFIARDLSLPQGIQEAAFSAGLLHDIGELVMIQRIPDDVRASVLLHRQENMPRYVAERQLIEVSHAEVGGFVLGVWGLPEILVEATVFHHDPWSFRRPDCDLPTVVFLANVLDHIAQEDPLAYLDPELFEAHVERLGLSQHLSKWQKFGRISTTRSEELN